jgi:hypothetical protein
MRDTFLRMLTDKEKGILYQLMLDDKESGYRAKIILLKDDGYTVPEIRRGLLIIMRATSESGYTIVSMKKVLME